VITFPLPQTSKEFLEDYQNEFKKKGLLSYDPYTLLRDREGKLLSLAVAHSHDFLRKVPSFFSSPLFLPVKLHISVAIYTDQFHNGFVSYSLKVRT
jgi:hypothetical protein